MMLLPGGNSLSIKATPAWFRFLENIDYSQTFAIEQAGHQV
jgi:hypothetical protein